MPDRPLQRDEGRPEDVHTCHAECPCHTGGEPRPDFTPAESLTPTERRLLLYMMLGEAWEDDRE